MSVKVANVALTDTFDTWRIRSNQGFTNLFAITGTKANAIDANNVTSGLTTLNANVNITGTTSGGGTSSSSDSDNDNDVIVTTHVTSPFIQIKTIKDAAKKLKDYDSVEFSNDIGWPRYLYDKKRVLALEDSFEFKQALTKSVTRRGLSNRIRQKLLKENRIISDIS